jgi:hypothetical protein
MKYALWWYRFCRTNGMSRREALQGALAVAVLARQPNHWVHVLYRLNNPK